VVWKEAAAREAAAAPNMKWRRWNVVAMEYPSVQRPDVWAALTLSQGKSPCFLVRHFWVPAAPQQGWRSG
jgi:hypothetical protein